MSEILHRITIDAPAARVHDLIATTDGVGRWWTGREVDGASGVGDTFGVLFGDADEPAAVLRVEADTPERVVWRVVEGPGEWLDTLVEFTIRAEGADRTTLLFAHSGWRAPSEFMSGCSTNWGAYLTSLKSGAERGAFAAFPEGEISRWS